MPRDINLNNVNISLQEFQRLSAGKYNAGEVKLSSETRLAKINNHVHRLRSNDQSLSHTEILVIKDAFVKALSQSGVAREEVARVRRELGLAPEGTGDKELSKRSLQPLTRQQIREILDRNARAINEGHQDAPIVRTARQLHRGRTEEQAERVERKRGEAAAATRGRRTLDESRNLSLYQKTLAGDTCFLPQKDRPLALRFAKAQKAAILQNSENRPGDQPCTLTIRTDTGAHIEVASGASEAETIQMLDELILQLTHGEAPTQQDISLQNAFLAIGTSAHGPNPARAYNQWAYAPETRFLPPKTLRTAAVTILLQRGILDYNTLALVNKTPIPRVIVMIQTLLSSANGFRENRLRQNPYILLLNSHMERANVVVPPEEQAYIPALPPARRNALLADLLTSPAQKKALPFEYHRLAAECREAAVQKFGEECAGDADGLHGLANEDDLRAFCNAETAAGREVTAYRLHDAFLDSALKNCALKRIAGQFKALLPQDANADDTALRLAKALTKNRPGLLQEIIDAAPAGDTLAPLEDEMRSMALRGATVDALRGGPLQKMLSDALSTELELSEFSLLGTGINLQAQADAILDELGDAIDRGTHPAKNLEQIRDAFQEKATESAHQRAVLLAKVDALRLPARHADTLKALLLGTDSVRNLDLDALAAQARVLDLTGLFNLLATSGAPDKNDVYDAMHNLGQVLFANDAAPAETQILAQLATAQTPGLADLLDYFFARYDVKADLAAAQKAPGAPATAALPFLGAPNATAEHRAALANAIGTAAIPPLYEKALLDAIDGAGLADLPRADKHALFAPGTELGQALRNAAIALPDATPLLPCYLKALADGILASLDKAPLLARIEAYQAHRDTVEAPALRAGYHKSDLSMLCHAFGLCQQAMKCSNEEALRAVLDPATPVRKLYGFGGRFLESPENFAKGLTLLQQFQQWFPSTTDAIQQLHDNPGAPIPEGTTRTAINADFNHFTPDAQAAFERFLFQEIALNPELPLEAQNPEDVFGMEHNPATRYVGRGYTSACANTVAQIPPKARQLLYQALDLLQPLQETPAEANHKSSNTGAAFLVGRVLAHLEEIEQMRNSGTLTRENFLNRFYNEIPNAAQKTAREIFDWYTSELAEQLLATRFNGDFAKMITLSTMIICSGRTVEEGIEAVLENRRLPNAPYISNATGKLADLDGTPRGGREQLVMDLVRPTVSVRIDTNERLLPEGSKGFVVRFSDGTVLCTRHGNGKEDTAASAHDIAHKVESFVGHVHPEQLSAVCFALSQSGAACMKNGLTAYGIQSDEHAALVYDVSRDEGTGAITIHYSQPAGFPLKFHWETYITLDGATTTTPLVVEPPEA